MSTAIRESSKPPAAVRAEAALWLAHLRGPSRNPDVEHGFRLWLEADPAHAAAFELATDIWERAGSVRRHPHEQGFRWVGAGIARSGRMLAVAAALVVLMVGALWYLQRHDVTTAVGEQRSMTLADGSRIFLNTDTRVVVQYDERERRIRLDRGEAIFQVAKQAERPFVVSAGLADIQALGTSFVVRRDPQRLAVTLVDGQVSVAETYGAEDGQRAPPRMLSPGERMTLAPHRKPAVDAPMLDKVTAWQRGQVAFDNVPLAEAVAEMNRYNKAQLVVERPEAAAIPVGGIFRADDAMSFAQAMVETYRLKMSESDGRIVLAGVPESPTLSQSHRNDSQAR